MQKNVPKYTRNSSTVHLWAETSQRNVAYALCNDRPTLLWFANQRAVEYHPTLVRAERPRPPDAPRARPRPARGRRVRDGGPRRPPRPPALADAGLAGAVKPSGAKGVHVFVPIDARHPGGRGRRDPGHRGRAERLDPELATTAFMKDDRGGKVFVDATRVGGAR